MSRAFGAFRSLAFLVLLLNNKVTFMDKTVPAGAAMLLDFVGSIEAPRGYGTIYGNKQHKLSKPLTEMSLSEVLAAQPGWSKNHGSSAAGRYQFMRATLQGLIKELGLSGSQKLDANLQDRLGYHLLKRRGYDEFAAGKLGNIEFGKRLAQEWASLPVLAMTKGQKRQVARGQSYYAGDGINKSLVAPEKVETVLAFVKEATKPAPVLPSEPGKVFHVEDDPPAIKPGPAPKTEERNIFWRALFFILNAIFGKGN